ncbi:ester cyclase [Rhizobium sp. Leaf384]|uniref:ester cyclase n=1 Tax=unclassified Rhizobium TaxID=2613769 RepID=UPI000716010E|nr:MULTISPECIES: ester cyclase [unclassified Rhizobium]KQS77096.1 ester cyclase [Rhizobium sp. Leaf384]KQS78367.1 ester cyclase [Rhizobium sp. Leaf383]
MTGTELSRLYREYIDCLNRQAWSELGDFVCDDVRHNGRPIGVGGYRAMLETDFREIPDLAFRIVLLVADPPVVASRLAFDCTPSGMFLGLPVNGRRVRFSENVFYTFRDGRIEEVWSAIDKAAIEAQVSFAAAPGRTSIQKTEIRR